MRSRVLSITEEYTGHSALSSYLRPFKNIQNKMKSTGENTIFMNQSNFRTCRVYTAGPTCGGMGLRTLPKAPVRRQRHLPRCCSSRCQVQRGHGNNRMSPQRPFQHHGILGDCINNQPFPLAPAERACQRQMDCCLLRTEQEKVTENIDGTAKLL